MADNEEQTTEGKKDPEINIEGLAQSVLKKKKQDEHEAEVKKEQQEKVEKTIVTLRGRIDIFVYKELKALSNKVVKAYEARDSQNKDKRFVAYVCHNDLPPRRKALKAFQSINHRSSGALTAHGFLKWGDEKVERYVLIFENNYGRRLMQPGKDTATPMSSDVLIEMVIKPMCELLTSFDEKGFVHGAIRPDNMYENTLDKGKSVALAPCLAYPFGYDENVLFEPIEIAMAEPDGKGDGYLKNDLYALGVSIALLMIGKNPVSHLSASEIIEGKLRFGTFALLLGQQQISGAVNEVLRGLLVDNMEERWGVSDLQKWVDGTRQTPRQTSAEKKAERPFDFRKKNYTSMRLLARDFAKYPKEAFQVIKDESVYRWLDRTLGDEKASERYAMATAHLEIDDEDSDAMYAVVARVVMALDPVGPIRYRGRSFMPTSLGQMLCSLIRQPSGADLFRTILSEELVPFWYTLNADSAGDPQDILRSLKRCMEFLRRRSFGNGIERCLYFLNRDVQCLSSMFEGLYVYNAIGVVVALQIASKKDNRPKEPFDAHIGAYLMTHFSGSSEGDIQLLGNADLNKRYHAMLTLFASIQNFSEINNLSGLAGWVMELMDPVIEQFNSRKIRAEARKELQKIASKGSLVAMLRYVNNVTLLREDMLGFSKAQLQFLRLEKEKKILQVKTGHADMGVSEGKQISAFVSFILSLVAFVVYLTMLR